MDGVLYFCVSRGCMSCSDVLFAAGSGAASWVGVRGWMVVLEAMFVGMLYFVLMLACLLPGGRGL